MELYLLNKNILLEVGSNFENINEKNEQKIPLYFRDMFLKRSHSQTLESLQIQKKNTLLNYGTILVTRKLLK